MGRKRVLLARRDGAGMGVEGTGGGRSHRRGKRRVAGRGGVWRKGGDKSGR